MACEGPEASLCPPLLSELCCLSSPEQIKSTFPQGQCSKKHQRELTSVLGLEVGFCYKLLIPTADSSEAGNYRCRSLRLARFTVNTVNIKRRAVFANVSVNSPIKSRELGREVGQSRTNAGLLRPRSLSERFAGLQGQPQRCMHAASCSAHAE